MLRPLKNGTDIPQANHPYHKNKQIRKKRSLIGSGIQRGSQRVLTKDSSPCFCPFFNYIILDSQNFCRI